MIINHPAHTFNYIDQSYRQHWIKKLGIFLLVLLAATVCAFYSGLFDGQRLARGVPDLLSLLSEMLPPDFSGVRSWLRPATDTLVMSVAGTALAIIFSLPMSLLAARNTSPHPAIYHVTRLILNGLRSIPELIMGIIFVAAVGFGALPGVLALGFHSIGMVGKFFAESIEHVDPAPVEAVRSSGMGKFSAIYHGVLPQVLPQLLDTAIYRWEYNFRASTVMGMVGAGGIGFELMSSLRLMRYKEVAAILLVILVAVTMVDGLSSLLRKHCS